jgi:hypothetical protein
VDKKIPTAASSPRDNAEFVRARLALSGVDSQDINVAFFQRMMFGVVETALASRHVLAIESRHLAQAG